MKPTLTPAASTQLHDWWKDQSSPLNMAATRTGFGEGLASSNGNITALTANLGGSTNLTAFKQKHPDRCYDLGVAEQAMAGIAAGLASEGSSVVMTSFAVFSPGRNWDIIRTQIALQQLPVIIVGSHAGLATGEDGATHQALEDIALMRSLPGMTIISPGDAREASQAIKAAIKHQKPVYLRLTRAKTPLILNNTFALGKGVQVIKGTDIVLISTGTTLFEAINAAKQLWDRHKKSASVLHLPTITPLDTTLLAKQSGKLFVTIEDHHINGGLGSSVAEYLAEHRGPTLLRIGTKTFGESGTKDELYKKHGLDARSIVKAIMKTSRTSRSPRRGA